MNEKCWIIVDGIGASAINNKNIGLADDFKKLCPMLLNDNRAVLPADILTDCGLGRTWEAYADILQALPVEVFDITPFLIKSDLD